MSENQENKIVTEEVAPETPAVEETAPAAVEAAEAEPVVEEKPKKKGKAGKVVLFVVLGLILAIVLATGIGALLLMRAATTDNLPAAPSATDVDLKSFAADAAVEVLNEKKITVGTEEINLILDQVKASVNGTKIEGADVKVNDLFCDIKDGEGTIYCRAYVGEINVNGKAVKLDKVFPVQIDFDVDFVEPEIVVIPKSITCGTISFPMEIVGTALEKVTFPENMRAADGNIYYDTSKLDGMIDEILAAQIQATINDSDVVSFLGGLLGEDTAASLADKLANAVVNAAQNATDVQIFDAQIEGENLILQGQVM